MKTRLTCLVKMPAIYAGLASAGKPRWGRHLATLVLALGLLLSSASCNKSSDEGSSDGGGGGGPGPTPVSITTVGLPAGTQGTAYNVVLQATGGTAPYSWSLSAGALPAGLTLATSGSLSGTPTANGLFTITVTALDSATPTAQAAKQFDLNVYAPAPPYSGTFGNHTTYVAGMAPYLVYAEHLNGDTKPDIVVVNPVTNKGPDGFSVLLNTGSQTFAAATTYDMASTGTYSCAAFIDLNADGKKDIVVADPDTYGVHMYRNTGSAFVYDSDITFYAGWSQRAYSLAVGDVDGDGTDDLVIGSYQGTQASPSMIAARVWRITGAFTLIESNPTGLPRIPYKMLVANLNGDSRGDLVIANPTDSMLVALLGANTASLFSAPTSYSVGAGAWPVALAVADINGDGFLDVATANYNSGVGTVSLMAGNGSGVFTLSGTLAVNGTFTENIAVADLNGDGKPDVVVSDAGYPYGPGPETSGLVSVFLNQNGFTFAARVDYAVDEHPRAVVVADIDEDGKPDIITANAGPDVITGPSTISVLYGQP